jgi:hypothetical protein
MITHQIRRFSHLVCRSMSNYAIIRQWSPSKRAIKTYIIYIFKHLCGFLSMIYTPNHSFLYFWWVIIVQRSVYLSNDYSQLIGFVLWWYSLSKIAVQAKTDPEKNWTRYPVT